MSRKSFITLVVILLAIFIALGWYLWTGNRTDPTNPSDGAQGGLFPGGVGNGGVDGNVDDQPSIGEGPFIDLNGQAAPERPRLRKLSDLPSAGVIAFDAASTTLIRFVERATGHIYETKIDSDETPKISNTTLPKIYEALWSSDGSKLLMRYLRDSNIRTFYAQISSSSPETALEGLFLADNIESLSVFGSRMFQIDQAGASAQGSISDMNGSKRTVVFASSFNEWDSVWSSSRYVTIFSKPSAKAKSGAYLLDTITGLYKKAVGGLAGLRAIGNGDGSLVLYSATDAQGGFLTAVADVKTETIRTVGLRTLVDKCIWSAKETTAFYCAVSSSIPRGTYPDDWYKGKVFFDDSLWRIDAVSGETREVFNPLFEVGERLDMYDLRLNQSETALVFRNKYDVTPWIYELVR